MWSRRSTPFPVSRCLRRSPQTVEKQARWWALGVLWPGIVQGSESRSEEALTDCPEGREARSLAERHEYLLPGTPRVGVQCAPQELGVKSLRRLEEVEHQMGELLKLTLVQARRIVCPETEDPGHGGVRHEVLIELANGVQRIVCGLRRHRRGALPHLNRHISQRDDDGERSHHLTDRSKGLPVHLSLPGRGLTGDCAAGTCVGKHRLLCCDSRRCAR